MLLKLGKGISGNSCHTAGGGGGGEPEYLSAVVSSVCCDLDATIADSYGGTGQTWANLIASPADGSVQTDYDFYFGTDGSASSDDPAFNGTAGNSAAYFSGDGGDFFNCVTLDNYLKSVARTDVSKPVTFVMTFNVPNTSFHNLFGIGVSSGGQGWTVRLSGGSLQMYTVGDSGGGLATIRSSPSISAATDSVLILSFDHNTGTGICWINSVTGASYTPSTPAFTSDSDTNEFAVMAGYNNANPMSSGSKLYSFAVFNEIFDDTKAAAVIAHLEARHGRDYTP